MISLLLLPLLLLPSIQGQTCDMAGMEERMEEMNVQMKEEMEEKKVELRMEMEKKVAVLRKEVREEMEEKESVLRIEMTKEMKEKETTLRKELASKEEVGRAVTQGLRDLPYLTLCAFQGGWYSPDSIITYNSFLTDFNNGERPGGADGQLDLATGVFTCLSAGIYSVIFSGRTYLNPTERVNVYLYLNNVMVPESRWYTYTDAGAELHVLGSRSLVSVDLPLPPTLTPPLQMLPLQLGDTLELRTASCTGDIYNLILCIELADQGLSARP